MVTDFAAAALTAQQLVAAADKKILSNCTYVGTRVPSYCTLEKKVSVANLGNLFCKNQEEFAGHFF
jgi:hypothetical protein